MKISFIIPWISQGRGGTENVGHLMANAMAEKGHQVKVYTFDSEERPSRWPLNESISLHYLPENDDKVANSQMAIALAEPCPDLLVGLHMNRTLLRYARVAQKLDVPLVLSEHIDPHFPRRLGVFEEEERHSAFSVATVVHLLSNVFVDTVPEYLRGKIHVIPNTVKPAIGQCDPVGGACKNLITIARLVPRKNMLRLIDEFSLIAAKYTDWKLQILGDGPQLSDLKRRAQAKGISHQVEFLGHCDDPYRFLKEAQIFVFPSLFEGFPMSSLEAMAHGLPLVGYAACNGINEQILDGVNGRLAARSLETGCLSACLDELMSDSALRIQMGAQSQQRYEELYSNQIVFDAWETMFIAASESIFPENSMITSVKPPLTRA